MAELPVLAPVTGRGVKPAGRRGRGGERRRWTVPWRRPRPRRVPIEVRTWAPAGGSRRSRRRTGVAQAWPWFAGPGGRAHRPHRSTASPA